MQPFDPLPKRRSTGTAAQVPLRESSPVQPGCSPFGWIALGLAGVLLPTGAAAQDKLNMLCTANQEWCQVMAADFQRKTGV